MKPVNLVQRRSVTLLRVTTLIAGLLLATSCGVQQLALEPPTPSPTLTSVATATPVATATTAPTNTSEPPTDTPAPTATAPPPTAAPTDTPEPALPPTDTPTVTPQPLMGVSEAEVVYHDAQIIDGVATYEADVLPWLDLLVRLDGNWYGPERYEDDITAAPLPEGYRWEADGSFSSLPNGEAWWNGPDVEGKASLIGPDGNKLHTLQLRIDFY
jgi:hypothetical protein